MKFLIRLANKVREDREKQEQNQNTLTINPQQDNQIRQKEHSVTALFKPKAGGLNIKGADVRPSKLQSLMDNKNKNAKQVFLPTKDGKVILVGLDLKKKKKQTIKINEPNIVIQNQDQQQQPKKSKQQVQYEKYEEITQSNEQISSDQIKIPDNRTIKLSQPSISPVKQLSQRMASSNRYSTKMAQLKLEIFKDYNPKEQSPSNKKLKDPYNITLTHKPNPIQGQSQFDAQNDEIKKKQSSQESPKREQYNISLPSPENSILQFQKKILKNIDHYIINQGLQIDQQTKAKNFINVNDNTVGISIQFLNSSHTYLDESIVLPRYYSQQNILDENQQKQEQEQKQEQIQSQKYIYINKQHLKTDPLTNSIHIRDSYQINPEKLDILENVGIVKFPCTIKRKFSQQFVLNKQQHLWLEKIKQLQESKQKEIQRYSRYEEIQKQLNFSKETFKNEINMQKNLQIQCRKLQQQNQSKEKLKRELIDRPQFQVSKYLVPQQENNNIRKQKAKSQSPNKNNQITVQQDQNNLIQHNNNNNNQSGIYNANNNNSNFLDNSISFLNHIQEEDEQPSYSFQHQNQQNQKTNHNLHTAQNSQDNSFIINSPKNQGIKGTTLNINNNNINKVKSYSNHSKIQQSNINNNNSNDSHNNINSSYLNLMQLQQNSSYQSQKFQNVSKQITMYNNNTKEIQQQKSKSIKQSFEDVNISRISNVNEDSIIEKSLLKTIKKIDKIKQNQKQKQPQDQKKQNLTQINNKIQAILEDPQIQQNNDSSKTRNLPKATKNNNNIWKPSPQSPKYFNKDVYQNDLQNLQKKKKQKFYYYPLSLQKSFENSYQNIKNNNQSKKLQSRSFSPSHYKNTTINASKIYKNNKYKQQTFLPSGAYKHTEYTSQPLKLPEIRLKKVEYQKNIYNKILVKNFWKPNSTVVRQYNLLNQEKNYQNKQLQNSKNKLNNKNNKILYSLPTERDEKQEYQQLVNYIQNKQLENSFNINKIPIL